MLSFFEARPDVSNHVDNRNRYFSCVFSKANGSRCGNSVGQVNRNAAFNAWRALIDTVHRNDPIAQLMTAYVNLCHCHVHGKGDHKSKLSQKWKEELENFYRDARESLKFCVSYAMLAYHSPPPRPNASSSPSGTNGDLPDYECPDPNATDLLDRHELLQCHVFHMPGSFPITPTDYKAALLEHDQMLRRHIEAWYESVAAGKYHEFVKLTEQPADYVASTDVTELNEEMTSPRGVNIFKPYPKLPRDHLKRCIERPLCNEDTLSGFIYAYTKESAPGLLKIGYTTLDPTKRLDQWSKKCHESADLKYLHIDRIPHVKRVESLIHTELQIAGLRRREYKCPCGCQEHIEWFQTTFERVKKTVSYWTSWATDFRPYDQRGLLTTAATWMIHNGKIDDGILLRSLDINRTSEDDETPPLSPVTPQSKSPRPITDNQDDAEPSNGGSRDQPFRRVIKNTHINSAPAQLLTPPSTPRRPRQRLPTKKADSARGKIQRDDRASDTDQSDQSDASPVRSRRATVHSAPERHRSSVIRKGYRQPPPPSTYR
ncbi:hypothetical protein DV736_g3900, partial [Chaetothyriales sp. CBS 134916]